MDELTSALDPLSAELIEELTGEMRTRATIVIVTHDMEQAARVSDQHASLLMAEDRCGEPIESGATTKLFSDPADPRTLDYPSGRFG